MLANVALPAAHYVAMVQKLPAMKDRLHELEDERERRQPELEDSELMIFYIIKPYIALEVALHGYLAPI